MLKNLYQLLKYGHGMQRINLALARGALTASLRQIDPRRPTTWEFTAFSQNGEDGIIDYLIQNLKEPNRYFIEIGAADGLENNTSWLAIGRKYAGIMIEGNPKKSKRSRKLNSLVNTRAKNVCMFVEPDNIPEIFRMANHPDPDVFSLDIDGNDFHIARAVMESGFRPKIFAVEFNSAFGPRQSLTIKYQPGFQHRKAHPSGLYYGVSIAGWKTFFDHHGYRFVTVDRCGVNGFFIDRKAFAEPFQRQLSGLDFVENQEQALRFRGSWQAQFEVIREMEFFTIE